MDTLNGYHLGKLASFPSAPYPLPTKRFLLKDAEDIRWKHLTIAQGSRVLQPGSGGQLAVCRLSAIICVWTAGKSEVQWAWAGLVTGTENTKEMNSEERQGDLFSNEGQRSEDSLRVGRMESLQWYLSEWV